MRGLRSAVAIVGAKCPEPASKQGVYRVRETFSGLVGLKFVGHPPPSSGALKGLGLRV